MNDVFFRRATIEDRVSVLKLLSERQQESNKLHGGNENFVIEFGADVFNEMLSNPNVIIIVGEVNKKIIASLTIHLLPQIRSGGYYAIIEDVLVSGEYRHRGIGKNLMRYAINICIENGKVKKIKLGTRTSETKLHTFYESLGFKFTERMYKLVIK